MEQYLCNPTHLHDERKRQTAILTSLITFIQQRFNPYYSVYWRLFLRRTLISIKVHLGYFKFRLLIWSLVPLSLHEFY